MQKKCKIRVGCGEVTGAELTALNEVEMQHFQK
jgi:hypothetical protein